VSELLARRYNLDSDDALALNTLVVAYDRMSLLLADAGGADEPQEDAVYAASESDSHNIAATSDTTKPAAASGSSERK
jgi:hypothetical protein